MLETRATVVQIDGQYALVQANHGNGCEQCNGKGCGTGKLSKLFCSKPRQFRVNNPVNAGINDEVIVSVADGSVFQGIALVYILPLLLLFLGAALGSILTVQPEQRDVYSAVGAFAGLVAGFVMAKWISLRQPDNSLHPYIARIWRE
jgi:sigma-E factor negative regulatory protein RseC